jgi:beta-phosphoglucomutase-like phosphatase (HAD superfamily)
MTNDAAVDADTLAVAWEWALDAAARATDAAGSEHLPAELFRRERELQAEERQDVEQRLHRWLPARPPTAKMLGLPAGTRAVVLDLDGVLTDSHLLHAAAWAEALDPVLQRVAHSLDGAFVRFDRGDEYRLYFEGRPRLEGIRLFLASRGVHLPDDGGPESVHGIARRKSLLLERRLHERQLVALPGARRYVQAAAYGHVARAVVSASESTRPMLELARLNHLVDVVVDAEAMREGSLRPRPAPDTLLAACERLGVRPADAVSLTQSAAGVVAALHAGLSVLGIAAGGNADDLRAFGADAVMPSLLDLLDPAIRPRPA